MLASVSSRTGLEGCLSRRGFKFSRTVVGEGRREIAYGTNSRAKNVRFGGPSTAAAAAGAGAWSRRPNLNVTCSSSSSSRTKQKQQQQRQYASGESRSNEELRKRRSSRSSSSRSRSQALDDGRRRGTISDAVVRFSSSSSGSGSALQPTLGFQKISGTEDEDEAEDDEDEAEDDDDDDDDDQEQQMQQPQAQQLQRCLSRISNAMGLQDRDLHDHHITVSGSQMLMGMEGHWFLTWHMDGRFYERYEGPELCFEWASDGELGPWGADAAGRVSSLDLDDREVSLLAAWMRTGFWLTEEGQELLSIHLEEPQQQQQQNSAVGETALKIHLKDGKVMAYVVVKNGSWLPARMTIKAFGSEDRWEYGDWQPLLPSSTRKFPRAIMHHPPAGGNDIYSVTDARAEEHVEEQLEDGQDRKARLLYSKPASKLVSRSTWSYPKTHIDKDQPSTVKMIRAESGHYLIRPLVDGQDIGYFIVDTGASSLTITPAQARELGMYSFGEAFVTGVEGEVKCSFKRAKSFQIGPLTIAEPIFMEVPLAGVVRGVSPVAGICGYDIFFHCIVEMSYKRATLSLYDPSSYKYSFVQPSQWKSMHMLENVPHVPATFNGEDAIFLLDTGAGGVDIIFHGRAVQRFRLNETLQLAGSANVKGINTSGTGLQVQYGILDTLQLAGQTYRKVKALFPTVGTGGSLDFSEYTAGVLCGDLFGNLLLVLDYGARRFAVLDSAGAGHSSRSIR